MNVVLLGIAGSGKGTQADLLKNKMNLLSISAGDVLRDYRKNPDAKYTKIINSLIDDGKMVPDEIVSSVMFDYIANPSEDETIAHNTKYSGIIYDGYPRRIGQLYDLNKYLSQKNQKIDVAFYIKISEEVVKKRLNSRVMCGKCGAIYSTITYKETHCSSCGHNHLIARKDDLNEESIKARFQSFHTETKDVIDAYKEMGVLIEIDGEQSSEAIFADIQKHFDVIISKK